MPPGVPANTSGIARLILGELGYQVGWQERIIVPPPGAGNQWSHVADGRFYERLISATFQFTASAVVATRFIRTRLTDTDGRVITQAETGDNVVASGSVTPYLTLNSPTPAQGSSGDTYGYIPDILIPPGWTWGSIVFGMDPGDAFTNITLLVQRFPNDAAAQVIGQ